MNNLALQIGEIDLVKIKHAQFPDARGCQIHRDG